MKKIFLTFSTILAVLIVAFSINYAALAVGESMPPSGNPSGSVSGAVSDAVSDAVGDVSDAANDIIGSETDTAGKDSAEGTSGEGAGSDSAGAQVPAPISEGGNEIMPRDNISTDENGVIGTDEADAGTPNPESLTDGAEAEEHGGMTWVGVVITIIVILAIVFIIIALIPKKNNGDEKKN